MCQNEVKHVNKKIYIGELEGLAEVGKTCVEIIGKEEEDEEVRGVQDV